MSPHRIMVVEDEGVVAADIRNHLIKMGYEVTALAMSGEEAVQRAKTDKPDLILMDIALSGEMDGIEAADIIRDKLEIPVIFLTAYMNDEVLARAKVTEPFGYLLKPFQPRELYATMEMALYKARLESKLRKSEERFRTMADFTYDWEVWRGSDSHYIYVSPSCQRITGYSREEFLENLWLIEQIAHPDDRTLISGHLRNPSRTAVVEDLEFRIITREGQERWLSHNCQPVYNTKGEWQGRRGSYRDITKRKRLENRIMQDEKLKSLGLVAGGVAHNYNNILNGILGYCELSILKMGPDSAGREELQKAIREAYRAVDLTRKILSFTGKDIISPRPVDISGLVRDLTLQIKNSLPPGAVLEMRLGEDLPQFQGSPDHLQQMILNIVTNASEALPDDGGIVYMTTKVVHCDLEYLKNTYFYDGQAEGDYVCLEVADNGRGINPADIDKLFDPFFTTKFYGRGLGLGTVLGIIRAHEGAIEVWADLEKGAKFRVLFPVNSLNKNESDPEDRTGG